MRTFRDEEGATSVAVVLAILLSITLLAACLQQYWTNSSSNSVQAVADASALAAGDAIAKTVFVVQMLDAVVLTSNLFGLVLHAVVLVAGIVVVLGFPALGPLPTAFLSNAVEFDKQYMELRKSMIRQIAAVCRAVSAVAPVSANIQALTVADKFSESGRVFSGRDYEVVVIPIPLTGSIECDETGGEFDSLDSEVVDTADNNEEDASKIKDLEDQLEALRRSCFDLDVYKQEGTSFQYWTPSKALNDFDDEWRSQKAQASTGSSSLDPLENTASSRSTISGMYRNDTISLWEQGSTKVNRALYRVDSAGYLTPSALNAGDMTAEYYRETVWVVPHSSGERKAYHSSQICMGLSNAAEEPESHSLDFVFGDYGHPPCLLCRPLHWGALMDYAGSVSDYIRAWNQEREAILEYEDVRRQIEALQGKIADRTESALDEIISQASAYLKSGRMTYNPSGERGLIAIATSAGGASVPKFALPALIGTTSFRLGRQVAVAGARLVEARQPGGVREALIDMADSSLPRGGLGQVLRNLLGDSDDAVFTGLSLWGACLEVYTDGINGLTTLMNGLPWGLDVLVGRQVNNLINEAGLSKPDLRRIEARLVPSGLVGDPSAPGAEGNFVRVLREAKTLYAESSSLGTGDIGLAMEAYVNESAAELFGSADDREAPTVLGEALQLPLSDEAVDSFSEIAGRLVNNLLSISESMGR